MTKWCTKSIWTWCATVAELFACILILLMQRPGERARALITDAVRKTYWIYTESSLFEISVKDEEQDLWRVHLAKQTFDTALKFAKQARDRTAIYAAQADHYFDQGRMIQAAEAYAQSSKPFEEVVLRFIDKEERDALRYYLSRCLEKLKKNVHAVLADSEPEADVPDFAKDSTQRMMLATWLVEIYLSKINQLEDIAASESASDDVENYRAERAIVEDDLKHFLQQYKDNLDKTTVFSLIGNHGRSEMLLHFATVVEDHARIVAHWIAEEDWQSALLALARQVCTRSYRTGLPCLRQASQHDTAPYYRYASTLLKHAPKATVDAFMRQSALDPKKLIPALLHRGRFQAAIQPQAIRFLEHCIFIGHNVDPAVHNSLLTLHAIGGDDEAELLHFLETAPVDEDLDKPYYDLDYALRLCKSQNHTRSCVHIYSKMGFFESSVELALENDDLEMAKVNADLPLNDVLLRKKLWLKIAKHVVKDKNDLKASGGSCTLSPTKLIPQL